MHNRIIGTGDLMKRNSSIFIGWKVVILALVIIASGLPEPAYCQTDGTALLLQQTPLQGGKITPAVGIHKFELNTELTLTAVPEPGYQFIYWLGDVSDPTVNNTTVYLDAPKIVIAVFERARFEFLIVEKEAKSAPFGGLRRSVADYGRGGFGGGGAKRPDKWSWPTPPEEEEENFPVPEQGEEQENFPVPETPEDFPVPEPIPEPATVILLALGGLLAFAARRTKNKAYEDSRQKP